MAKLFAARTLPTLLAGALVRSLLTWIFAGAVVGGVARLLLPGRDPIGCLGTIFLGIAGALIGGRVWQALFPDNPGTAWIGSILVAMFLLAILRRLTYPRNRW